MFYCNNWPPQPALVDVDNSNHPVTKNLPASFVAPASEWYQWNPSPRLNKNVKVLCSISPKNYPFGIKDVINFGDFPVVWTNTKYRMIGDPHPDLNVGLNFNLGYKGFDLSISGVGAFGQQVAHSYRDFGDNPKDNFTMDIAANRWHVPRHL